MKTIDKIDAAFDGAIRRQNRPSLAVLRSLKAEISKFEKETKSDADDTKVINLVKKALKQREESAAIYRDASRTDLFLIEQNEIDILKGFLPEMMTEASMCILVDECIAETGASTIKQMGQVMGLCQKKAAGTADGKFLSGLIRSKLA